MMTSEMAVSLGFGIFLGGFGLLAVSGAYIVFLVGLHFRKYGAFPK